MVDANFANDPEAAHIVLRSGADITLVGMDVTMTTLFSSEKMDEVAREGDAAAKTLMRIAAFYVAAYTRMYPGIEGCSLHDPLAVAIAEDRSLARTERMFVDVALHGELTRGQTIADRRRTSVALHNADVCMEIDRPRFEANFLAAIERPSRARIVLIAKSIELCVVRPLSRAADRDRDERELAASSRHRAQCR